MDNRLFFITIFSFVFLISCSEEKIKDDPVSKPVDTTTPSGITTTEKGDNSNEKIPEISIVSNNNIVAHRGAWKKNKLPQNSIASLKEAIRLECKGSEFDVMLTADDSLVINHDNKYNNLIVEESNYSDLIALKLSNGEKLPTFREYILAGIQNNTKTLLYCEFKNYAVSGNRKKIFISKVLECVKKLNAQPYVAYHSFDFDLIKQLRVLNSLSDIQNCDANATLDQIKNFKLSGVNYNYSVYAAHPDWIESAHEKNLRLTVYTDINDVKDVNFYLSKKFDAIITDEPESALKTQSDYK